MAPAPGLVGGGQLGHRGAGEKEVGSALVLTRHPHGMWGAGLEHLHRKPAFTSNLQLPGPPGHGNGPSSALQLCPNSSVTAWGGITVHHPLGATHIPT